MMRTDKKQFVDAIGEIRNTLEFLAERGCQGFECSKESLDIIRHWGRKYAPVKARTKARTSSIRPGRTETLKDIRRSLGNCRRCGLCDSRVNIVFGEGNPKARLVFVGEAPGRDEDKSARLFVGEAGALLTRIIENAMKLRQEEVYVCNVIKCRPPGNRDPEPDEIRTCLPFLERQIRAISPEFICTLGALPARTLLRTPLSIPMLRGRFHKYEGIRLIPTYHPEDLLRHPQKKRETWEDIQQLMKAMS